MSTDSIASTKTYYPFQTPATDSAGEALQKLILDARLFLQLPDGFAEPTNTGDWFYVWLYAVSTTTTGATFTFKVHCSGMSPDLTVEVAGTDYRDMTPAGSHVLIDKDLLTAGMAAPTSPAACILHPACFVVWQEAPAISAQITTAMQSNGARTTTVLTLADGMNFISGNNVTVGIRSGGIYFRGYPGGGTGKYSVSPWSDITELYPKVRKGLRSLNGLYGNVTILGSKTAAVTVSAGPDSTINISIAGEKRE